MHCVFIGIGSNLDQPEVQVLKAIEQIKNLPNSELISASSLSASQPQGPQDQPDFVNAVVSLKTNLLPHALLTALQSLEQQQGKVKVRHWGERVIDLDVLLSDDLQLQSDNLVIPHPQMHERDFVLLPLSEIAPNQIIPALGSVKVLLSQLKTSYLKALS
jgi:2-amino-4-hydroxy-6-hydroxymethyldihydropteridine diphosphokinase